jgi:hypothetical protein
MRILAIDPGRTTGFCIYDSSTDEFHPWEEELTHLKLWNVLSTVDFDAIICEKFEFRKDDATRDKIDYYPAQLEGVVRMYVEENTYYQILWVGSARIGKTAFWSDDNRRVKQLGLYDPKASPHGMDALRHLLYHLTFTMKNNKWLLQLKTD